MNALLRLHALSTRFDSLLTDWGGSLLALAIRLYVGWQFLKSGMTKIADWDSTLFLFRDEYSVPVLPPEVAAVGGTLGELILPLLLFIGLLSRPAALGLFVVNLVAVISYPALVRVLLSGGHQRPSHLGSAALGDRRVWTGKGVAGRLAR